MKKKFTHSAKVIMRHELKERDKYTIVGGHPDHPVSGTFKTKKEAYEWIKKHKFNFKPSGFYK